MTAPAPDSVLADIVGWLNYRGNQLGAVGQRMGPSTSGEIFTVTVADYDPQADTTRLGLEVTSHQTLEAAFIPAALIKSTLAGYGAGMDTLVRHPERNTILAATV